MRRLIASSIILMVSFGLFAVALAPVDFRGFQITAQRGGVQEVSITPIVATSLDDDAGIPFDLEDEGVAYSAATNAVVGKRRIASWSLYSNFAYPKVTIDAPHLRHDATGTEVGYRMAFYYQFSIGEGNMVDGNIIVDSGIPYDSSKDGSCKWNDHEVPVNFTDRPVRLMLTVPDVSDDGTYPPGRYSAVVMVTVEGG